MLSSSIGSGSGTRRQVEEAGRERVGEKEREKVREER